jgi:DNA invertase Pin-like site-specific DNA recombinase
MVIYLVGTTPGNLAYHACVRDGPRSDYGAARCGTRCRLTPRPWDEARQKRQDSCIRCVGAMKLYYQSLEDERRRRGPIVAGYLRASTDRQIESPKVQQSIILTYCERQGLPEPVFYSDPDTSGEVPVAEREAGRRMMRDLGRGDHVVVARLDRLSRSFLDFALTVDAWCKAGISLHPCDFPVTISPENPWAMAFVQMLMIFAEQERKLIAVRIREAMRYRVAQGRKVNREAPWGFRHEKKADGHEYRVPDEYESTICLKAAELALDGYQPTQIADYLTRVWRIENPRARQPVRPDCRRHHRASRPATLLRAVEQLAPKQA